MRHMWRLSEAGPRNLGLAFSDDGLLLGHTSLVERRDGRFVVRPRDEIERLLKRAYDGELPIDRLMSGFVRVAAALNANDQCSAHIAAVHMRMPDLASPAIRDALVREDTLIKYTRDDGAGSADWNPALHPRTGTAPNPGWFAPTGGAAHDTRGRRVVANDDRTRRSDASPGAPDDWVHLPPGDRIDELGDFLEWLANAKPEDEQKIREEINRYWGSVGDVHALSTLNAMLSEVLKPATTRDDRQQILNLIDHYSRYDPRDTAHFYDQLFDLFTLLGAGLALGPRARLPGADERVPAEVEAPAAVEAKAPSQSQISTTDRSSAEADAQAQAQNQADAAAWKLGRAARGRYFEWRIGRSLHENFPVIDSILDGIATSIKSIDLNAATYQNAAALTRRLVKYVGEVSEFMGDQLAGDVVLPSDIKGRALSLAVPKGSITPAQRAVIEDVRRWAKTLDHPVDIIINEF
jgi:contact-dependent growth inhibition (CDI) system restriction endonuclease-like protein